MHAIVTTVSIPKTMVWEPLEGNIIKLNFDASYNQQYCTSYSGVVARNIEGRVMALCTYLWENVLDPTVAEVRACFQAVAFAEDLDFSEVCLEGDKLTVIKKLSTAWNERSVI